VTVELVRVSLPNGLHRFPHPRQGERTAKEGGQGARRWVATLFDSMSETMAPTETVQLKRLPAAPRTSHTVSVSAANKPETIAPAAYGSWRSSCLCWVRCKPTHRDDHLKGSPDVRGDWVAHCNLSRRVLLALRRAPESRTTDRLHYRPRPLRCWTADIPC
jgi:hypothetical protein